MKKLSSREALRRRAGERALLSEVIMYTLMFNCLKEKLIT